MPPPEELGRLTRWRDMAGVALAAGIRPCAGALIVLVFALSQGLFAAGIAATFAMALGTALTTGAIAALAVFSKAMALRLAGGRGASGAIAIAGLELLAAAFVLVLGASLPLRPLGGRLEPQRSAVRARIVHGLDAPVARMLHQHARMAERIGIGLAQFLDRMAEARERPQQAWIEAVLHLQGCGGRAP